MIIHDNEEEKTTMKDEWMITESSVWNFFEKDEAPTKGEKHTGRIQSH